MHNSVIAAGEIEPVIDEWIEFESGGQCLVIGDANSVQAVVSQLEGLIVSVCSSQPLKDLPAQVTRLRGMPELLQGWLGNFKVQIAGQPLKFDLVLDLGTEPYLRQPVLPLGYFAPAGNAQALAEALQQLPELVGLFDKPRFFNYKPSICAHSRRGISGCQQCLAACPAEAISSAGERIEVNPNLCQGCGSCTAVCPSGAISYAVPTLDVSLDRCRRMLQAYAELETQAAHLLIHDALNGEQLLGAVAAQLPASVVSFSIEEIGALGLPFWLAALAYGAGSITVWDALSHSDHAWTELQQQIDHANQLLAGLGYATPAVHWLQTRDSRALVSHCKQLPATEPLASVVQFAGLDDKRRVMSLSLAHLHQQAPAPVSELALPQGVPFGEIQVDKQACTLCMSCVSVCPVGALVDGVDKPQLNFIEDLCVQCGMCETACPESAISLSPRYLFDQEQRRHKRVLHEEAIFHCIRCNKPFATQKMIDTITERLKDHHMFQGAALERLKMCEDCRVKSMF